MKFKLLDWDTEFFGFKVAELIGDALNINELNESLALLSKEEVKLVYGSFINEVSSELFYFPGYEAKLVDKKVTYLKDVNKDAVYDPGIFKFNFKKPSDELLNLAVDSGVYSRFNFDKRIPKIKFQDLYKLWMINSVNGSLAKSVLVYKEKNKILGMITLTEKGNRADIGLIAVNNKFRGMGIGKKLIDAGERWAQDNAYKKIQVVTQGFNLPACILYDKMNFKVESIEYFYHFWLNKNNGYDTF